MNKKYLLNVPLGAGGGTAIYQLLTNGIAHVDWYRVATVTLVALIIALPLAYFSQQKK